MKIVKHAAANNAHRSVSVFEAGTSSINAVRSIVNVGDTIRMMPGEVLSIESANDLEWLENHFD